MRLSQALLDRVEAALPPAGEAGLATRQIHDRVGGWNRTTVRHALRELIRRGRAGFSGRDRHRRYRRASPRDAQAAPLREAGPPEEAKPTPKPASAWREYAARGDGSVRLPDEPDVAAAMRRQRIRYRDVEERELRREERLPQWSPRPRTSEELTRAVFGDPAPGRRHGAGKG